MLWERRWESLPFEEYFGLPYDKFPRLFSAGGISISAAGAMASTGGRLWRCRARRFIDSLHNGQNPPLREKYGLHNLFRNLL